VVALEAAQQVTRLQQQQIPAAAEAAMAQTALVEALAAQALSSFPTRLRKRHLLRRQLSSVVT